MLGVYGTGIDQCYHSKHQRANASVNFNTRCKHCLKIHSQVASAFGFSLIFAVQLLKVYI